MPKKASARSNEPDKPPPILRRSERLREKRESSTTMMLINESKPSKIKKINDPSENQLINFINSLDHDCLAKIMKYCSPSQRLELEKVCTRWEMVGREYAWDDIKKVDFIDSTQYKDFANQEELAHEILLRCSRYLKELAVPRSMSNSKIVSIIKDHCHNLTKLCITLDSSISADDFMEACTAMKNLQSIDIDVRDWFNPKNTLVRNNHILDNIPDNIIELILSLEYHSPMYYSLPFDKFKNLQCLSLHLCKFDRITVEKISQLKTLVELKVIDCVFEESQSPPALNLPNLERIMLKKLSWYHCLGEIAASFDKVKYINIHYCDISLQKLLHAKNLEFLNLNCSSFNDKVMIDITNNCKNLKHLEIYQGGNDAFNSFEQIKKLTNLEHLECSYKLSIDYSSISVISTYCIKLKYLELHCEFKGDEHGLEMIGNLENLESLILHCEKNRISVDTTCRILQGCKKIKKFIFSGSFKITKSGFKKLPISRKLESLEFIRNFRVIDDELLLGITKKFESLKVLNLGFCKKISNPDIKMILENCPSLGSINFFRTGIKLETLIAAAKATKYRENKIVLSIRADKSVTEKYEKCGISSAYLDVEGY